MGCYLLHDYKQRRQGIRHRFRGIDAWGPYSFKFRALKTRTEMTKRAITLSYQNKNAERIVFRDIYRDSALVKYLNVHSPEAAAILE